MILLEFRIMLWLEFRVMPWLKLRRCALLLYILFWLERGIIPYGSIYNKMSKRCILQFVVISLKETLLNYLSSYFTRIYYKSTAPSHKSIFSKRKGAEKLGPGNVGRSYSGGKSSDFPTFTLSEFPNKKKVQVWNSLMLDGQLRSRTSHRSVHLYFTAMRVARLLKSWIFCKPIVGSE